MFSRWFISGPFWHHGICSMKDGPQSFGCSAGHAPWMELHAPVPSWVVLLRKYQPVLLLPMIQFISVQGTIPHGVLAWMVTALVFIPFVSKDTILSSMVRITLLSSILFSPSVSGWLQLPAQINKVSLESLGGISLNLRRERKPQKF